MAGPMENDSEIARLNRLYTTLSLINQAIVLATTRQQLLSRVCQILVEHGNFQMAWVGWLDFETRQISPIADWGDDNGYLQNIKVYADERPEGLGPSGTAMRTGQPCISGDMLNDSNIAPWQNELAQRGLQSSAAFPVKLNGQVCATLTVYSTERWFFRAKEIALLTEVAHDISFGLDNIVRDKARRSAEKIVRQERDFSQAMLNSLPGVLYMYDETGKFLRWNDNFARVTGYSATEIASMHPLDFFQGEDRERVAARIGDVFKTGESSIEAGLVSKTGEVTPYQLTGVLTQLDGKKCLIGVGIDISARKQEEAARRASEASYRTLFEYAPDGILIADTHSNYKDANPGMCRLLGLTHEELIGLHASDIVAPSELSRIEPALDAINQQSSYQREWRFRRKNGSVFPADVIATVMPDGNLMAMVRDISERVESEKALRDAELRFHTLFSQAPVGVVVIDPDTAGVLECNEQAARQLGYTVQEFSNLSTPDFEASLTPEQVKQRIQTLLQTGRDQFETRHLKKSGEIRDVQVTARLLELAGRTLVQCIVIDITDRKQAERMLRETLDALEHKVSERTAELQMALVRAEAADKIKSAFLATMSHELRTPLNSIIGFTGMVVQGLAGPLNAEQKKQLGMVRGSARHLLELINDVLDLSKIEAGQLEVRAEAFDLPALIERVTASVQPLAARRGLSVEAVVSPGVGEITSDRRRVEQILLNLLNNAIKFTERGGVRLTAELMTSSPEANAPLSVCLRVSDSGIGITPDNLATLFQPFRQIDNGLTRQHDGTGLGLAICRRLADLLGATIAVESQSTKGSTFTVTLPLNRPAP